MPAGHRSSRRTLLTVLAYLALTAQLVVSLIPLAESRFERTLAPHVEQTGGHGHFSHDEATCAACQARSIHPVTSRRLFEAPSAALVVVGYVMGAERLVSTPYHPQANPRAPPQMI